MKIMSMAEYQQAEGISNSGLAQIAKSPAHFQNWLKFKTEPTKAMIFGSALHCALLEPDKFAASYTQAPDIDRRTKEGKANYALWESENAGRIPFTSDDFDKIRYMQDSFYSNSLVSGILKDALIERSMFWKDPKTGVVCKGRPDIVTSDGLVVDLKTTEDARPREFSNSVYNWRYHVQAAMYLSGVTASTQKEHKSFIFVAIEKTAPFAIAVYTADDHLLSNGRVQMEVDLETYAQCVKSNTWPAYPDVVQTLTLPAYATITSPNLA